MTKTNVLESLLDYMMETLVVSIQQLNQNFCIVPDDFYLPAPPIYCAQMLSSGDFQSGASSVESKLRIKLSVLCKCIIILLSSSNLHVPLIKWYLEQLNLVNIALVSDFF